jgi:hypothetical protein
MMIWNRARCAWVKWTGSKAAWLALPAASAIVVSACLPVIGARMPLGPAAVHRAAHHTAVVYPAAPVGNLEIAPPLDYVGTPIAYLPSAPTSAPMPSTAIAPPLDYVGTPAAYLPSAPTSAPSLPEQPAVPAQPVPEPESAGLLATAILILIKIRNQKC